MNSHCWKLAGLALLCLACATPAAQTAPDIVRFDKFRDAPLSAVRPTGWLKEFLSRQKSGLTGHPDAMSYPFDRPWWGDTLQKGGVPEVWWWPYEQTGYYTDALLRLGYLLQDPTLIQKADAIVQNVLNHPQKSGRLGPNLFSCQWPIAVFFRVLQADYLATGDERVIDALHTHYLSYTVPDLAGDMRTIVNLEGLLWTYGHTGDRALLDTAEAAYAESNRLKLGGELTFDMCSSADPLFIHGCTHMEEAKVPALLYSFTGKRKYLDAAVNVFKKLDRDHMLPDGVPSSNENLTSKNPRDSHETCDISDYTWAAGYLLMATGDATWADHIERAIFNAGPGAVCKDFKALQYFSSPNQVIATGTSNHNGLAEGSTWMQYRPYHQVECCAGNVNRFMPNYAARMWMRDSRNGLVAALYGPSEEGFSLAGKSMTVMETTDYPFSDTIKFHFEGPDTLDMPFTFRIPGWCKSPSVRINGDAYAGKLVPGTFATLQRMFESGDEIVLRLPMEPKLVKWGAWGVEVERGPLLYAFAVPEKATVDDKAYDNLQGKKPSKDGFPALDLRPNGPWNYALAVDEADFAKKVRVIATHSHGYPFDPASVPLVIKVPARRVTGWTLLNDRYTPELPEAGKFACEGLVETITLVPYGSTRLRLSVFPQAK